MTLRVAQKGAKVKGIDVNPQMLEIAQKRASKANLTQNIELCEMGVAELGGENLEGYDIVMSGLCFSELTEDELIHTVKEVSPKDELLPPATIRKFKLNLIGKRAVKVKG